MKKTGEIIYSHNLILSNDGKKEARNLQVIHLNLPENFQVFPAVKYNLETLSDGTAIVFPIVVPGEQITICYFYFEEYWGKIHAGIKHEEGQAEIVSVLLTRQYSKTFNRILQFLVISGAVSILYIFFFICKKAWLWTCP